MHIQNSAERDIQTFKNHFIARLCSTHADLPMHLWCRLIPQATLTLNPLRTSRINSRQSAEEQLHGTFNFNRVPLAPPGTKIIVHEKPSQRPIWAPHGVNRCYLVPETLHYICHTKFITEKGGKRISDTVHLLPSRIEMPTTNPINQIFQSEKDLTRTLIEHPKPSTPHL